MTDISWEPKTAEKFTQMLNKIPVFLRAVAKDKVSKKACEIVKQSNRTTIMEKDMVDAFFMETPGGFHGPMKTDMEALNIDYTKYGYARDEWKKIMGMQ